MESLVKWNSDLKPQPPLGIFGLLNVSVKTIKRNRKLMLPVVVLAFLSFLQLEFVRIYLLQPVAKHLASPLAERYLKLVEDLGDDTLRNQPDYDGAAFSHFLEFLMMELFILSVSSIISLFFLVATVSSSSEAYTEEVQTRKEMMTKIKKSWKKPFVTSFYMILINLGSIFLCIFSIGVTSILAAVYSWEYLYYGVVFVSAVLWIHVAALWMTSMVVSVIEDAGGLDSIIRGRELMKGKKVNASLLMGLFAVAYGLVYWMENAILILNLGKWQRMVISNLLTNGLQCGLKLCVFVVFTIFYHEQKVSCDLKAAKSL